MLPRMALDELVRSLGATADRIGLPLFWKREKDDFW